MKYEFSYGHVNRSTNNRNYVYVLLLFLFLIRFFVFVILVCYSEPASIWLVLEERERKKRVCFSPNCELSHFLSMIPYRINSGVLQDQCVHCQTHIYASQVRILHTVLSLSATSTLNFSHIHNESNARRVCSTTNDQAIAITKSHTDL